MSGLRPSRFDDTSVFSTKIAALCAWHPRICECCFYRDGEITNIRSSMQNQGRSLAFFVALMASRAAFRGVALASNAFIKCLLPQILRDPPGIPLGIFDATGSAVVFVFNRHNHGRPFIQGFLKRAVGILDVDIQAGIL
jgi:hypothetical protein